MRALTHILPFLMMLLVFITCNPVTQRLSNYEVHGIDVSHYQRTIDWETVSHQDIDFVFVKASEGETYQDSFFVRNWVGIDNLNIIKGAYHFFYPSLDVDKQVHNFSSIVQLDTGDLPPVLDFEHIGNLSKPEIVTKLKHWLTKIEAHYNIRPIIYTNYKLYKKYIHGDFEGFPIWIARYNSEAPYLKRSSNWQFWQYGDRGEVHGIKGDVDLNVFHSNLEELKKLCIPPPTDTSKNIVVNPAL